MTAEAQKKRNFLEIIREPQWECCTFAIAIQIYLHRQFERNGTSLTARRPIARREKPKLEKRHKRTINQFINQHKN